MATTVAPAPVDDSMSAIDVLAFIPVTREVQEGYNRDLFGDWQDADGNGCDTRHEVLISESLTPVQIGPGCSISNGAWTSAYDGVQVADASALDIDHVVALKEAWDSGAWAWDDTTRAAFANDLSDSRSLIAVTAGSNRSKGDRDPSNWLPSDPNAVCAFIGAWIAVKARWQLAMDESEWGRIKNQLNGACAGLHLAPWPPATVTAGPPVTTTPTPASATTAYQPPTPPVTSPQADVYYKNCAAAKAAGAAPLHVGEPGYRDGLDRDHDGVACEN